ncbi:unnamed protein product [Allacma fusca]|uniref:Uncharacterized protein n=1 Tax=Allacma fusca TaxID=39272 RepID=A0A8J2PR20_9HEXA|nr:unnamed protein product [Allacma fusca]
MWIGKSFFLISLLGICAHVDSADLFKCGSGMVSFPTDILRAVQKSCEGDEANNRTCYLACIKRKIGYINPDNSFNIPEFRKFYELFPDDVRSAVSTKFAECEKLTKFPPKFDPKCSEFRPFEKCVLDTIASVSYFQDKEL